MIAVNIETVKRRGFMLVLSAPSGAGKTTVSRRILQQDKNMTLSISVTTRKPRPGEIDGKHYIFVTEDKFKEMIDDSQFAEYAKVFSNYYGTLKDPLKQALWDGHDVLFDIDWQGTQQLTARMRQDIVSIFLLPPSMKELEARLHNRAQDSAEVIAHRMEQSLDEISHWGEYDYIIINEDLDKSVEKVQCIIEAERLRRDRQFTLPKFVRALKEEVA